MTRRFDRKILIPKILEQNTNNLLNFDFHPLPNSSLPSVSNTGWSPNPKLIRKYKKGGRRGAKSIGGGGKNLVTRHREIQEQTEAVDGRPVIGSHRVYTTAVVSKSRNKWSRRNAKKKKKKNRGARRPNYPLPAARRWLSSFRAARVVGGGGSTRRRREVEIKFHVETVWLAAFREWFSICDAEAVVYLPYPSCTPRPIHATPARSFFWKRRRRGGGRSSAVGRDPHSAADRDVMIAIFR